MISKPINQLSSMASRGKTQPTTGKTTFETLLEALLGMRQAAMKISGTLSHLEDTSTHMEGSVEKIENRLYIQTPLSGQNTFAITTPGSSTKILL